MKSLILSTLIIVFAITSNAQPCKLVKPGMTSSHVLELVGEPDEMNRLGSDNGVVISVWHYGNQRISFTGEIVDNVVADGKSQDELAAKLAGNVITRKEFTEQMEEINRKACN